MASRKVRVASLFLDEGFGALDEEALETALETLPGLQQDGKLIGIISHVSALKKKNQRPGKHASIWRLQPTVCPGLHKSWNASWRTCT